MKAPGFRIAAAILALLAVTSACSRDESPSAGTGKTGIPERTLSPLPPAPRLELSPEALPGAAGALAVVAARPQGEAHGDFHPTITFSKPVVSLQGVAEEQRLPDPAVIEPAVPGEWRWLGSSTVEFVPREPLPYATAFQVRVPGGLRALDGSTLGSDYVFGFSTPRPVVQRVEPSPGNTWLGDRPRFTLILNQPVEDLAGKARLLVGEGGATVALRQVEEVSIAEETRARAGDRRYPWMEADTFRNQQTRYVLEAAAPLPLASAVVLEIDGSLRGRQGPLTLGETVRHDYRTVGPMRVTGIQRCMWMDGNCPWGPVVLRTSNPVALEELQKRLQVEPAVEIRWEQAYVQLPTSWGPVSEPHVVLPGTWRPGTTYTVKIAAGLTDTFGQAAPAWGGTVRMDDREPELDTGGRIALLESRGDGGLPIETVNVRSVQVELWPLSLPEMARVLASNEAPGRPAPQRTTLDTRAAPNRSRWTPVPVRELLGGARSGLFALRLHASDLKHWDTREIFGQITDLAVHAKLGATSGVIWVTRLSTGASVPGAQLSLYDRQGERKWQGSTDDQGIAFVPGLSELVPKDEESWHWEAPFALIGAEKDGELGVGLSTWMDGLAPTSFDLPIDWDGSERRSLGLVFAERGIYRPGDTVHTKGVARFRRLGELHKLAEGTEVEVALRSPRGERIGAQKVKTSRFGTFHADFAIAADAPLGTWMIEASGPDELYWFGNFRVEEYRAPQFQVDVRIPQEVAFAGDPLRAHVSARYLFGGAMADAEVSWAVNRTSISFEPPGNAGFAFGNRAWWWDDGTPMPTTDITGGGKGVTDAQGAITVEVGRAEAPAGKTWKYTVEAEVKDVNRQRVAARASIDVHPAAVYAGARVATTGFAEVGREVPIELIAAAPDGKRVEGIGIDLEVKRRTWQSVRKKGVGGQWFTETEPVEEPVSSCRVTSAATAQRCTFLPKEPGLYLYEATVTDAAGRKQTTRDSLYVVGGGWVSWQRSDTDRIDLVADQAIYEPGQTAKILVKSPWPEAEALLTVERAGVRSARRVRLSGAATTLEVPVDEEDIPNVFVGVLLVRGRVEEGGIESGEDPGRPAVRVGYVELKVEKAARRLQVAVRPDADEKKPRQKVRVDLLVTGHDGEGVPAELAVWAVDEAVLRLTGYEAPDLLDAIYPRRGLSVRIGEPLLHLVQRRLYGEKGQNPGGGGGGDGFGGIRSQFKTTVLFSPAVIADAQGRARVEFDVPDNLTTWRILAVAVSEDDRFGSGAAQVRVSKPLLALPALPRAARVGDHFEAGVVLHGHRFSASEVKVSAEAEGLAIEGATEQTVAVVEGRPTEVRFRFTAEKPSTAVLRFRAAGGGESDGVEQRIPIRLPVAMEAVAVQGDTTGEKVEGLVKPADTFPGVGGLELSLASTALAGLDENFDQLIDYPWGCLEQESSRLVPFVALRELAGRFGIPWKTAANDWLDRQALERWGSSDPDLVAQRTVKAIEQLQNHDGGYRYWPSSPCSSQYGSAWAVWALHRAGEVGYTVDRKALEKGKAYLADVVVAGRCDPCGFGCTPPGDETRIFALWTLARTGSPRPSYYGELFANRKGLPLFAKALLADAMFVGRGDREQARQLLTEVLNHAKESPNGVHFEESDPRTWAALWSSDVRTTAIVLGTLTDIAPDHPYVAKIARWLEGARGSDGRYDTTQEAAFALTSLVEVSRTKESVYPDFTARVALGGEEVASHRFEGRTMTIERVEVPLSRLEDGRLSFSVDGKGVLYYGARLRYAPAQMPTDPLDRGFVVQRWFEPWQGGGQARRFAAGELVRVRVRVASSQERHYGVIEVPLPAGLEAVDTSLATTAALPRSAEEEPAEGYEYESAEDLYAEGTEEDFGPWAEQFYSPWTHTEIRDDRVILFADRLPPGVHVATFAARATTPGLFVLPPAHAEEMYAPEVFGRSDGGNFVVDMAQPQAER